MMCTWYTSVPGTRYRYRPMVGMRVENRKLRACTRRPLGDPLPAMQIRTTEYYAVHSLKMSRATTALMWMCAFLFSVLLLMFWMFLRSLLQVVVRAQPILN